MALAPQKFSLPFKQGVDTKTDPKQLPIGKLTLLENAVFNTAEQLTKRNGFGVVGTSLTVAEALATYKDELLTFDGFRGYSYNQANDDWVQKAGFQVAKLSSSSIVKNFASASNPDCAFHEGTGLALYTYISASVPYYTIIDNNTGNVVVASTALDGSYSQVPKPMVIGSLFFIYWTKTTTLYCKPIAVGNPTHPLSTVTVTTTISSTKIFDVASNGDRVYIAWNNNTSGISMAYMDPTLVVGPVITIVGDTANGGISVFLDSVTGYVWVGFYNGTSVKYFIRDSSLTATAILATTTVEAIANVKELAGSVYDGTGFLFYDVSGVATYNYLTRKAVITVGGTGVSAAVFLRSVGLGGKTFIRQVAGNTVHYVLVAYSSTYQSVYFLVDNQGKAWAKIAPGTGGGLYGVKQIPELVPIDDDSFMFAYLDTNLLEPVGTTTIANYGVNSGVIDFSEIKKFQKETLGNHVTFTGALPYMYDGINLVEENFNFFPESIAGTGTSGGSIADGTYQYIAIYQWMDNQGNLHSSAPGVAVSVSLSGGPQAVDVVVSTLRITSKTDVIIKIYRTEAGDSIFYCVSDLYGKVSNSTSADTVTFTDTYTDANLVTKELLYTTGGVLQNFAPPALDSITTYANRLIGIQSENKLNLWYSKQIEQSAPVEFSDFLTMMVDSRGGEVKCLSVLDDKLILMKAQSLFYIVGQGPLSTGSQNDFSPAIFITQEVGCENKRSIVQTPLGLIFQTSKGIYLLDRGLMPKYIGADVEAYNEDTVTSAVLLEDERQVRFTMDSGVVLVYDYYSNQWSIFTHISAQDSVMFEGQHTFVDSATDLINGNVFKESPTRYDDNGEFVKLRIRTGWLSLAEVQGFQRIREILILGDYFSPHRLICRIAYDFDSNNQSQTAIINPGEKFAGDIFGSDVTFGSGAIFGGVSMARVYQWRLFLTRQKCEAIQITIEDQQYTDFGQGFALSNLAFEVGVKQGVFKMPASKSFA